MAEKTYGRVEPVPTQRSYGLNPMVNGARLITEPQNGAGSSQPSFIDRTTALITRFMIAREGRRNAKNRSDATLFNDASTLVEQLEFQLDRLGETRAEKACVRAAKRAVLGLEARFEEQKDVRFPSIAAITVYTAPVIESIPVAPLSQKPSRNNH